MLFFFFLPAWYLCLFLPHTSSGETEQRWRSHSRCRLVSGAGLKRPPARPPHAAGGYKARQNQRSPSDPLSPPSVPPRRAEESRGKPGECRRACRARRASHLTPPCRRWSQPRYLVSSGRRRRRLRPAALHRRLPRGEAWRFPHSAAELPMAGSGAWAPRAPGEAGIGAAGRLCRSSRAGGQRRRAGSSQAVSEGSPGASTGFGKAGAYGPGSPPPCLAPRVHRGALSRGEALGGVPEPPAGGGHWRGAVRRRLEAPRPEGSGGPSSGRPLSLKLPSKWALLPCVYPTPSLQNICLAWMHEERFLCRVCGDNWLLCRSLLICCCFSISVLFTRPRGCSLRVFLLREGKLL